MALIHFVVHRNGEKWGVRSTGLERSFADEATARAAAVELANHSGKNGKPAIVLAELASGALETIWTGEGESSAIQAHCPDEVSSGRDPIARLSEHRGHEKTETT
jgi:hypothetical protein